ncbi:4-oxalocrotonate decarboxylase (fragment) [Mesorhizobium sp. ORS 3359]
MGGNSLDPSQRPADCLCIGVNFFKNSMALTQASGDPPGGRPARVASAANQAKQGHELGY